MCKAPNAPPVVPQFAIAPRNLTPWPPSLRGKGKSSPSLSLPSPHRRGAGGEVSTLAASRIIKLRHYRTATSRVSGSRHVYDAAGTLFAMKKTYRGSCHCGKIRFEIDTDLDHVRVCDCSMCRRRGALLHRVDEGSFRLLSPLSDLALYQWHTKTAKDYFCPTCGIQPFRRPRTAPDQWSINVRCLEGVDLDALPVRLTHGSRLE
jgi:hypothetical protein